MAPQACFYVDRPEAGCLDDLRRDLAGAEVTAARSFLEGRDLKDVRIILVVRGFSSAT